MKGCAKGCVGAEGAHRVAGGEEPPNDGEQQGGCSLVLQRVHACLSACTLACPAYCCSG
jgi:hypothetical protein